MNVYRHVCMDRCIYVSTCVRTKTRNTCVLSDFDQIPHYRLTTYSVTRLVRHVLQHITLSMWHSVDFKLLVTYNKLADRKSKCHRTVRSHRLSHGDSHLCASARMFDLQIFRSPASVLCWIINRVQQTRVRTSVWMLDRLSYCFKKC
jgi:hypothetical protein